MMSAYLSHRKMHICKKIISIFFSGSDLFVEDAHYHSIGETILMNSDSRGIRNKNNEPG